MPRSPITTHVLDTSTGSPAVGVSVMLEIQDAGNWKEMSTGKTDADGRVVDLLPDGAILQVGIYRLTFDTATYFADNNVSGFFAYVPVIFAVRHPEKHYHVPLLLSPFAYSTYRGS